MANIEPYVRTLYLRGLAKNAFRTGFLRRAEVIEQVSSTMKTLLSIYEVDSRIDVHNIAEQTFDDMLINSAFGVLADEFAGVYYQAHPNGVDNFKNTSLANDPINKRAESIGEQRYFGDVFKGFVGGETEEPLAGSIAISIPASDRIVALNHNQQSIIEQPLAALIEDVRTDNEVLDEGVKERIIGQMKAGSELIRSGSVRAYLVYHTLVRGLMELIARYRGRAIAIAAEKLVELLVEQIFQGMAS